ncbi:MAG: hypothetical protein AAFU72_15520, partial [Pseudomonadota bacterium]
MLATGEVHYVGQPVFAVVATSHLLARKAAAMAEIDYEESTPVLTIEDALAADSRFEGGPVVWQRGDALRALA